MLVDLEMGMNCGMTDWIGHLSPDVKGVLIVKKQSVLSLLLLPVLIVQTTMAQAETYVVPNTQETVEVREASHQDLSILETQLNQIENMDEDYLRIQLELQAEQIEKGLVDAAQSGTIVSEETRVQVQSLADSIKETARKPHLKKRLLNRVLMFLPRVAAQGLGYLTMGMTDLIGIPLIFMAQFSFFSFAGENQTNLGVGGGIAAGILTGAAVTIGELLVLGYAFPIYIGTLVPVQLTVSLICSEGRQIESPYTRKFCKNYGKNQDFLHKIGSAAEKSGTALNRFIRHPLKVLGLRKRR